MNWRRWHRLVNITLVLAVVAALIILHPWAGAAPDTVAVRPDGAGDSTQFTPIGAASNYECVNEVTDNESTYVENGGAAAKSDLYTVGNSTTPLGKINSVTIRIKCQQTATGTDANTEIITYATQYSGNVETPTASWVTYSTAYTLNPDSSANWTWLEINNLQAGVGLRRPAPGKDSYCTQVWVVVDYTPATLESYDDDIQSNVWGTVADPYAAETGTTTAYIYGVNFIASHGYTVGYYDNLGVKIVSDSASSTAGNALSSQYILYTGDAEPGTWHAVVFDDDLGSPPATYAETSGAAGYMVEDDFEVSVSAIPEFPTVMAGIVVAGLCFGAYYWMRKRRLAYVRV